MYMLIRVLGDLNQKLISSFMGSYWQPYSLLLFYFVLYLFISIYLYNFELIYFYLFIYLSIYLVLYLCI